MALTRTRRPVGAGLHDRRPQWEKSCLHRRAIRNGGGAGGGTPAAVARWRGGSGGVSTPPPLEGPSGGVLIGSKRVARNPRNETGNAAKRTRCGAHSRVRTLGGATRAPRPGGPALQGAPARSV